MLGTSLRLQPSNLKAEQALLGAIFANNKNREKCGSLLPIHFADPEHGKIYARVIELIDAGHVKVDPVTLKNEFDNHLLADLLAAMIGTLGVPEYAQEIKTCWMRRQAIAATRVAHEAAFGGEPGPTIQVIMAEVTARLAEITDSDIIRARSATAMDVVREAEATQRGDAGSGPIYTGISCIDSLMHGLWRKRLYIVMSRPMTGKTAAMCQFARHMARTMMADGQGEHVHIFCLDTSVTDYQTMALTQETGLPADQITLGEIDDWYQLTQSAMAIDALPIIVDGPPFDLPGFRLRARAIKRKNKTRVLFVDHRALLRRGPDQARMSEVEWVPYVGDALKILADELDLSLVALEHVNKPRGDGEPERPTRLDIPYNGDRAADELYALYRREVDMPRDPPGFASLKTEESRTDATRAWGDLKLAVAGQAEFLCLKRRLGSLGYRMLRFDGPSMTFREANQA